MTGGTDALFIIYTIWPKRLLRHVVHPGRPSTGLPEVAGRRQRGGPCEEHVPQVQDSEVADDHIPRSLQRGVTPLRPAVLPGRLVHAFGRAVREAGAAHHEPERVPCL